MTVKENRRAIGNLFFIYLQSKSNKNCGSFIKCTAILSKSEVLAL